MEKFKLIKWVDARRYMLNNKHYSIFPIGHISSYKARHTYIYMR